MFTTTGLATWPLYAKYAFVIQQAKSACKLHKLESKFSIQSYHLFVSINVNLNRWLHLIWLNIIRQRND